MRTDEVSSGMLGSRGQVVPSAQMQCTASGLKGMRIARRGRFCLAEWSGQACPFSLTVREENYCYNGMRIMAWNFAPAMFP